MSARNVDRTPFNRIPDKWAFDQEIGPFIRDIVSLIWQLRNRTGGDSDSVGELETGELFVNNVQTADLTDQIETLQTGESSNLFEMIERVDSLELAIPNPVVDLIEKPLSTTDNSIVRFDGTDAAIQGSGVVIDDSDNATFPANVTVQKRLLGAKGADVASANDITLGDGNYFDITGATQINTISATGWTEGSIVTIQFDGAPTVKHLTAGGGAQLDLNGAVDFVAAAGNHLVLQYASSKWWEISRKV